LVSWEGSNRDGSIVIVREHEWFRTGERGFVGGLGYDIHGFLRNKVERKNEGCGG